MAEREFRTSQQWPAAITPLAGDEIAEIWQDGEQRQVAFSALGGAPDAHEETHQRGGSDAVGTLEKIAYAIPFLESDGTIDTRVSDASTTVKGKVQLATSGEVSATKAVTGTDARMSDARTPTAHAEQHIAGTDVIADATVSNSGLMSASDKVKADATTPAYIPTEDQKAALAGSYGTPSDTNRYVTEDDIGVGVCPLESGLVPSSNLPSYVDDVLEYANEAAFPAIGETGKIYVALDVNLTFRWSGSVYVEISKSLALGTTSSTAHRGDHGVTAYNHSQETGNPHGTKPSELSSLGTGWGTLLESDSNDRLPTSDQKAALAGTSGTPSATNEYVTDSDGRLPTAGEKAALTGTSGTPGVENKYVTNADGRLPTAGEKAALVGSHGTPGEANRFVTTTDPRLVGGGGDGTTDALVRAWASFFSVFSEEQPTGQTSRGWYGIASHDGDLYATVNNGDIYKMDSAGIFQPTGQTLRSWQGFASHDGDLYAVVFDGDIYKMDSAGIFQPTGQTPRSWRGIASHDGDLYATVPGGDIYKMDGAGIFQSTGQTSKNWLALASHDGDLYAAVNGGDIYKMDSSGVFQPTGQTSRNWWGLASHDGDLYAVGVSRDIYKMDSSGVFQPTGQTPRSWRGIASHDGDLYATVYGGDIYILTTSNPSVNISKSNYTVPVSASFPINGRKVYRRTSAYDGNPVTITPPSGATFEGRASIDLYGQYSYVELERISATVFAIKDLKDFTFRSSSSFPLPAMPDGARKRILNTHTTNAITVTAYAGTTIEGQATMTLSAGHEVEIELIGTDWKKTGWNEKALLTYSVPVDCSSRVAEYTGDGIPLIPDNVAGRTYFQDEWATTDGFSATNGTISVSGGNLVFNKTSTSTFNVYADKSLSFSAKVAYLKVTALQDIANVILYGIGGTTTSIASTGSIKAGETKLVSAYDAGTYTTLRLLANTATASQTGELAKVDVVYIGNGAYDTPALDRAGNGNSLALNAVTPVNGKYCKEMSFNGFTSFGVDKSPIVGTSGTLIMRWKRNRLGTAETLISNQSATTDGLRYHIDASNNLYAIIGGSSPVSILIKSGFTDTASSHVFGIKFSASSVTPFYDGVDGSAVSATQVLGLANFAIGRNQIASTEYASGQGFYRYDSRIWTADEARAWSLNPISIDSRI